MHISKFATIIINNSRLCASINKIIVAVTQYCRLCYVQVSLFNNSYVEVVKFYVDIYFDPPFPHPELQMRLKDPFSLKAADMTKRTNKPRKPRDEESSDEVSGKSLKVLWGLS